MIIFLRITFFIVILSLLVSPNFVEAKNKKNDEFSFLRNRINPSDNSFPTWVSLLKLMRKRKPNVIVEVRIPFPEKCGCVRDNWSTVIFSDWACRYNAQFFSICSDEGVICGLQQIFIGCCANVKLLFIEPVLFLTNFPSSIDCFWLDTFDFCPETPCFCQDYHLRVIKAAYPKFNKNTIVIINDCVVPTQGAGLLVVDYLRKKGWKIHKLNFQVILVRD